MNWLIIPIEELKQFDPFWENRRKSVDGTTALLHDTTYDELVPRVQTLEYNEEENVKLTYPFPLIGENEVDSFLNTEEWGAKQEKE